MNLPIHSILLAVCIPAVFPNPLKSDMFPALTSFCSDRIGEFDQISSERKQQLSRLADYVSQCAGDQRPCRLVFVCTHNSRRSHLAQAWAQAAAAHFKVTQVECFSGGTEATAFNPRTVAALRRAGFKIDVAKSEETATNPKYQVLFSNSIKAVDYFSKRLNESPNPQKDFAAIMTCSEADKACPAVVGCSLRLALPYEDPKVFDGTAEEAGTYDLRCRQISREMLYMMSLVKLR